MLSGLWRNVQMLIGDLYKVWFEHFVAVLEADTLKEYHRGRFMGQDIVWYECPCGGDHGAARFYYAEGYGTTLSPVLTCFINNLQWLVKEQTVADIVRGEEEAYFKLLSNAEKIVRKVMKEREKSDETLHYLWDTHGIPEEVVNDLWKN